MANQINSEQKVERLWSHWRRWILGLLIAMVILISILIFYWPSDKITMTDRIQAVSAFFNYGFNRCPCLDHPSICV